MSGRPSHLDWEQVKLVLGIGKPNQVKKFTYLSSKDVKSRIAKVEGALQLQKTLEKQKDVSANQD